MLLAANVSFLAIPDVILFPDDQMNPGGGSEVQSYEHPLTSPSAILSYVSMLMSVGCILLGLMLVRQHRGESHLESYRSVRLSSLLLRTSELTRLFAAGSEKVLTDVLARAFADLLHLVKLQE